MKRTDRNRDGNRALLAAMYGERPPPGASPELMRAWIRRQADHGKSDAEIAEAIGWDLASVRHAIAERAAA